MEDGTKKIDEMSEEEFLNLVEGESSRTSYQEQVEIEVNFDCTEKRKLEVLRLFMQGTFTFAEIGRQVGCSGDFVAKVLRDPGNRKILEKCREEALDAIQETTFATERTLFQAMKILHKDILKLQEKQESVGLNESERKHIREVAKELRGNVSTINVDGFEGLFTRHGLQKALENADPNS